MLYKQSLAMNVPGMHVRLEIRMRLTIALCVLVFTADYDDILCNMSSEKVRSVTMFPERLIAVSYSTFALLRPAQFL